MTRKKQPRSTRPAASIAPGLVRGAGDVIRLLRRRKLTVVTAESCTGGLIAAALARAEGASEVLHGGFVVYTKEQKAKALGVSRTLLAREGAVNGTVARQLADGARRRSSATLALAITGVLGPAPDDNGNPVGLIFFAISRRGGKTLAFKRRFPRQSHDRLRTAAMHEAFALLCAYAPKKR